MYRAQWQEGMDIRSGKSTSPTNLSRKSSLSVGLAACLHSVMDTQVLPLCGVRLAIELFDDGAKTAGK